jgi:chemotaxis protein CheY-P-specific phosphatase CheC
MPAEARTILESAAMDAFEDLGFLLADMEPPEDARPLYGMRVAFRGPAVGTVEVWADEVLLEALLENMIGDDEPATLPVQLDALGEMANVICGNVLPSLEDPSAVFRLDSPTPTVGPPEAPTGPSVELGFEGGVVRVDFTKAEP